MTIGEERLPYPGLRSFTREETDLFFGREGCVDDMVDRLGATRFLAVLGPSGSGKSSLVKTGLLDALEIGLLHQAGSRWQIAELRPGDRPLASLAEGLLRSTAASPQAQMDEQEVTLLRAFLARGPRSVAEWCKAGNLPEGTNLLLLVDQFEELFRYGDYGEREEAEAFVASLLESAATPPKEASIYVAITMRSEYLGAAALIDGLAEAINKGLYLTPRMNRDEVREAIVGPAAVCGFDIEPSLVNRLLNDLTSFAPWDGDDTGNQLERLVRRADQLPLMQHVLNRLWSIAAARNPGGRVVLRLKDYDDFGGLRGALALHGREILDSLLPEHRAVVPLVFRALTAGSTLAEAVRRPTEFGELMAIAGGEEIAVREIVEAFRAPGRNFLVPPRPAPLRLNTVIDISHESLIRQWDEFAAWLQQEVASAAAWRRLVDQADRHQRREADLLSGLALASLASWWDSERPNAAWAKRYGGDFEGAARFLADSRKAEEARKEAETAQQRQKSRNRLLTYAAIVLICIVTPLAGFAGYSAWRENQAAELAVAQAARANAERQTAEEQRRAAEEARQEAEERRLEAEAAQREAEEQRQAADLARRSAEERRLEAEAAQREAEKQRRAADAARQAAEAERQEAEVARATAEQQRRAAESARRAAAESAEEAEAQKERALAAEATAREQATRANSERASAVAAQLAALRALAQAEEARSDLFKANLELPAQRILALQQDGAWDAAANLLGELWTDLIRAGGERSLSDWFIRPIRKAYEQQALASYPVFADFLSYAGFEGWTGTSGRFRVYSLGRTAGDGGSTAASVRVIAVFDVLTGAVTGSFELPENAELGSELDVVTPDGTRAAIVTTDGQIALWATGRKEPMLLSPPPSEEGLQLAEVAPVNSDERFALHYLQGADPSRVEVVDPGTQTVPFSAAMADVAAAVGLESIAKASLLGLVGDQLYLLVNDPDGRIVSVDVTASEASAFDDTGVTSAGISPDGAVLLTVACHGTCTQQQLTAYDLSQSAPLWVETLPTGLKLSENTIHETAVDGMTLYNALLVNEGEGLVYQFPKGRPGEVTHFDARSTARVGAVSFGGDGSFKTAEAMTEEASAGNVRAAGRLATFRAPRVRTKLRLYVAPNSVAVFQGDDVLRVAGVTYDGELLVYQIRADGSVEEDVAFRPKAIAQSNCIAAVAFGGDGRSLLFRHTDGSFQYVAAVGNGANIGWHAPGPHSARGTAELSPSSPPAECDAPEATPVRIVAADAEGRTFAVLDESGEAWWLSVESRGGGAQGDSRSATASSDQASGASWGFAPMRQAGSGVTWIAGDPARERMALVSQSAVDVFVHRREGPASERGDTHPAPQEEPGAGTGGKEQSAATLGAWRGEAKAAAFDSDGRLIVADNNGQLSILRETNGYWSADAQAPIMKSPPVGLYSRDGRVAVAHEDDTVVTLDAETGVLLAHGRLPANPSAMALRADGDVLSLEWTTDSAAVVPLVRFGEAEIAEMARLAAMRSLLDPEPDATITALKMDRGFDADATIADCGLAEAATVAWLEGRLLGDSGIEEAPAWPAGCVAKDDGAVAAAKALVRGHAAGGYRTIVDDPAFSGLLQAAADGKVDAMRLAGAVLARIAHLRNVADAEEISADAARFGTSLPAATLKAVASGAPIAPALLEFARQRRGFDPGAHQLLAHALERSINDIDSLSEALAEYSIAERLFRQVGRAADARFTGHRRAQLARLLPDEPVLAADARREAWSPMPLDAGADVQSAEVPADGSARRALDLANARLLGENLPGSILVSALQTELELGHIRDVASTRPKEAADQFLDLAQRSAAAHRWSPDYVRDYLDIAHEISGDPESAFRLSVEAMKAIAEAYPGPMHADREAVALFVRAADLAASSAGRAPSEFVKAAAAGLELPFIGYQYATLPGTGTENQASVAAAKEVLDAASSLAGRLAEIDETSAWGKVRGEALFWLGVLVNDADTAEAARIFGDAAESVAPLVEAEPHDPRIRFRYAEALRWKGLAEPSSAESAETERESISQYASIWDDRWMLEDDLLSQVGTGYGFALANLAQTIREVNLADVTDGRAAEDHAGWVLEELALAAEKDAVNAEMLETGAASTDSGFVNGWYRMSSYGIAIGFLSGLVNVETGGQQVTDCDLKAADPYDPRRRAPGVWLSDIAAAEAEQACKDATAGRPDDARSIYQLARAVSGATGREAEYLSLARQAAAAGAAPAYSLVAQALDATDQTLGTQAYLAASQHTIIEAFPVLYPFLASRASTEREKIGLGWLAEKAAALGVPEAHLARAALVNEPKAKLFHTKLAVRLWEELGNPAAAAAARVASGAISVTPEDAAAVDEDVSVWTPEAIDDLPEASGGSS
jgi:hypothetical protein